MGFLRGRCETWQTRKRDVRIIASWGREHGNLTGCEVAWWSRFRVLRADWDRGTRRKSGPTEWVGGHLGWKCRHYIRAAVMGRSDRFVDGEEWELSCFLWKLHVEERVRTVIASVGAERGCCSREWTCRKFWMKGRVSQKGTEREFALCGHFEE